MRSRILLRVGLLLHLAPSNISLFLFASLARQEEGKDFSFSQIKSSIDFLEVSARSESGLDKLKEVVDQYLATE